MSKYIDAEAFFKVINTLPYKDTRYPDAAVYNGAISDVADMLTHFPAADIPQWIPVTERLPEEDKEVLISYRYKEGEGDTSHSEIDITSYGQMYFGGNKVGNNKHWRAPFEYFYSNYEVIAWMPLPTPYKGGEEEC